MKKTVNTTPDLLGAHFSIAKGLQHALFKAATYGCTTLQIFTKNSSSWKERILNNDDIRQFDSAKGKTGIQTIASHTSYLINLATDQKKKHHMSVEALKNEMIRSSMLGLSHVVLHPGSHMGLGEAKGIRQIADSINQIFEKTPGTKPKLLLETTAGQGTSVGHTFEQLSAVLKLIENKKKIGICMDTAHIFAAGYDIRTKQAYEKTISAFDSIIGLENLYLIHLNDSKKELGSGVDRHEHIGRGHIGMKAFELIMTDQKLSGIPKIIETPKGKTGEDMDRVNLKLLRKLQSSFSYDGHQ